MEYVMDEATKKKFSKRVGITVRINSLQHLVLWNSAWKERRSMSSLVREATAEYLRIRHNSCVGPALTDHSIEE